ncbi:MAG: hypothetical protein QGF09_16705 [Rhodospirillales bacterium]|nr:hypothetical protein [Rhodospirillales bacterium]
MSRAGLFHIGIAQFPVEKLISHRMGLGEINLAMDRRADGDARRQIMTP